MITINIAEEFSKHPAGRTRQDGKFSGQRFREEFLAPALSSNDEVTVILDGARSYGSSFLDEAFGGLIREGGFGRQQLKNKLKIVAESKTYKTFQRRAQKFIDQAKND